MDAPAAEYVGDARKLREKIVVQCGRIRVDVVHRATVDSNRGQQARIFVDAREIGGNGAINKKDGAAAESVFNSAVKIVPLIHPAQRDGGLLEIIQGSNIFVARDFTEKGEYAVENTALVCTGDDGAREAMDAAGG